MHFRPYFTGWGRDVDKFLASYLRKRGQEVRNTTSIAGDFFDDISGFIIGGKRLRAGLVKLGYELAGGKNTHDVLPIATATEILHGAFLIHDDIIDSDIIRHGRPTIHAKYSAMINSLHYGESMGIIIGDVGFFEVTKIILDSNLSPVIKQKVLGEFTNVSLETSLGEGLDVELTNKSKISQEDVLTVHCLKTANYTFVGPLSYGALATGKVNEQKLRAINDYGLPIGIAFQLQDDILGMFGDEKILGKPVDSDIMEGKNTLLYVKALKRATKTQKKFLIKVWGDRNITAEEVREARRIVVDTGSLEYSVDMARKLVKKSKNAIARLTKDKKYQEILSTLADYIIEREK